MKSKGLDKLLEDQEDIVDELEESPRKNDAN